MRTSVMITLLIIGYPLFCEKKTYVINSLYCEGRFASDTKLNVDDLIIVLSSFESSERPGSKSPIPVVMHLLSMVKLF